MRDDYAILINKNWNEIMPIAALDVADGPKRLINKKYKNSILLWPDGLVEAIQVINIKGPYGNGWYRKLLSILNSNWSVEVVVDKKDLFFSEIKILVIESLKHDKHKGDFFDFTQPLSVVLQKLAITTSVQEIFSVLEVNEKDNLLDVF